jgi:hypothetical protein
MVATLSDQRSASREGRAQAADSHDEVVCCARQEFAGSPGLEYGGNSGHRLLLKISLSKKKQKWITIARFGCSSQAAPAVTCKRARA